MHYGVSCNLFHLFLWKCIPTLMLFALLGKLNAFKNGWHCTLAQTLNRYELVNEEHKLESEK